MYRVGQIADFPEKEAPRHFVPEEVFSEAAVDEARREDNMRRLKNPPKIKAQKAPKD
jgi:hypothetical protein